MKNEILSMIAAALSCAALAAPAPVVSSNGVTARSYSQTGLLAQWDGEENAGFGLHDSEATVWKNLSSQGSVWDMTVQANTQYSWEDKRIVLSRTSGDGGGIQGAFGVAHADSSVKQIETAGIDTSEGIHVATYPAGGTKWVLGNVNGTFWVREGTSYSFPKQDLNVFLSQSFELASDYTDWALYRENQKVSVHSPKYCGGLGSVEGMTLIGGVYRAASQKMSSVRFYSKKLTDGERRLNYAVDRIRFADGDIKELLTGDDCAQSPAVVVIGEPEAYGVSSVPYGVTSFSGSTNATVTLSGNQAVYEDGAAAFPDAVDPDNVRAVPLGWTLKIGSGAETSGTGSEFDLVTAGDRALVTWRFDRQCRVTVSARGGGRVMVGTRGPAVSVSFWNGAGTILTALPADGRLFVGWEGDVDGIDDRFALSVKVPNDRPRTLTARFSSAVPVFSSTGLKACSYIQKGLLAIWDGIENAGPGLHDSKAASWRNLGPGGTRWDLLPASRTYSWNADSLYIASGQMTNAVVSSATKQLETVASLSGNGIYFATCINSASKWMFGSLNGVYWVKTKYKAYTDCKTKASHSWDVAAECLYRNGAEAPAGSISATNLDPVLGTTFVGNYYQNCKPNIYSVRIYTNTLSAAERLVNYGVDRVRFFGDSVATVFGDAVYDAVPIVVVAGDPRMYGVSSFGYGINHYEGSTNCTLSLTGIRTYDDGVSAYPAVNDPDGARAVCTGYSLKIGSAESVEGTGTSVDLGTVNTRVLMVWKFFQQIRTSVSSSGGGSVSVDGSEAVSGYSLWSDESSTVTLRAVAQEGYVFSCWTGDVDGLDDVRSATQTLSADDPRDLKAVFVKAPVLSWNSYAVNGLAAQYDAEFNSVDGNGVPCHDPDTVVWKQLVTGSVAADAKLENATLQSARISWGEKSLNFAGANKFIIRGLNSTPGGGDAKGWFSGAYIRACNGVSGYGTEYCARITDTGPDKHTTYLCQSANFRIHSVGVSYSVNDSGTEWSYQYIGERFLPQRYFTGRGKGPWNISYAQHVTPEGGGTNRFYRNGRFVVAANQAINPAYSGSSYLNYFNLGSSNVNMNAFRVYTNTLDAYSIRWNSQVDAVRFLGAAPTDVALDIGECGRGTGVPAFGSAQTLPAGVPYTARFYDEALEWFDDGTCGYTLGENLRMRCAWRLLSGGPVPTVTEGDGDEAVFVPSNVLNRLEWVFPVRRAVLVRVLGDAGGQVALSGSTTFHSGDFTVWGDVGSTLEFTAAVPDRCKVGSWTLDGVEIKTPRPRLCVSVPVPDPGSSESAPLMVLDVRFERPKGTYIIIR